MHDDGTQQVSTHDEQSSSSHIPILARAIKDQRAILFVGAGVSMDLGLPSWRSLTERMADELGLDRALIRAPDVTYQTVAEYYRLKRKDIRSLSHWLQADWDLCLDKVKASEIHKLIVSLNFPIIYTTNFDSNLEAAFELHGRSYLKVITPHDLARASGAETQIVKFHGDFDDPDSLVLAESDHFERLSFDSPLDVKFRSDALGRTVLFIGYSMSDMNIRLLIYRLWRTWAESGREQDRPPSFIFMSCPNPIQDAVLCHWGINVIGDHQENPGLALRTFLRSLKQEIDKAER
jgi:hypothetical protein